jgi:hypothetical protein
MIIAARSTFLWCDSPDPRRMCGDVVEAVRQMHALIGGRTFLDGQPGPPLLCRSDWPHGETATAVGAHIMKFALDAIRAKRALVTANPRVGRIRWKIPVAILAVRPKLERHSGPITFAAEYVRFAGSNAPPSLTRRDHRKSGGRCERRIALHFGRGLLPLLAARRDPHKPGASIQENAADGYACPFQAAVTSTISALAGSRMADGVREKRGAGAG